MVEYDLDKTEDWIVNGELGHLVWERVNNSARVRFTDGIAILAKLVQFGEDTNLVRIANGEIDGPDDWAEPFSMMNPEMRMGFRFSYKLKSENPKEVKMAVYARTSHGANFVHEFTQEAGEPASAIIRVPVPEQLREEALSIADGYPNAEMVREQTGAFQERFNVTDDEAPQDYWEPHIELNNVESQGQIMELFDEVLDIVERGVRVSKR